MCTRAVREVSSHVAWKIGAFVTDVSQTDLVDLSNNGASKYGKPEGEKPNREMASAQSWPSAALAWDLLAPEDRKQQDGQHGLGCGMPAHSRRTHGCSPSGPHSVRKTKSLMNFKQLKS